MQHVDQHRLVAGRHQHDVRQAAQVGDVERPVVGGAVVADEAGAVHREHHVQPLQADVVHDLVVGALQEGRVDRRHRLAPLQGEARREQDRLLLGDADVEVAIRHRLLQDVQARPGVHRGGDPHHPVVPFALPDERFAKDLRVLRRRRLHRTGAAAGRAPVWWESR